MKRQLQQSKGFTKECPPSSRKESARVLPCFLIIWIAFKSPEPLSLRTASTHNSAKKSLCWERILLLRVVLAIFIKSLLNLSASPEWSTATESSAFLLMSVALRNPAITVCGWSLALMSFSASLSSSVARTTTEVVPSPTWRKKKIIFAKRRLFLCSKNQSRKVFWKLDVDPRWDDDASPMSY